MDINKCIENAINGVSKLNTDILAIEGMSSVMNRHLLNNLGAEFDKLNYLEIGVHKGSTFVSSLYRNNVNEALAIDNWSEFQNQRGYFEGNCQRFNIPYKFIEADCFSIDTSLIKNVNFYLYDGNHWTDKTAKGLTYFYDSLANEFLFVVDDFDWIGVREGADIGIKECNFKVKESVILESNIGNNENGWWNGLGIFILQK
jgi:hypothetical protein